MDYNASMEKYLDTPEEIRAAQSYLKTDKYRRKAVDFIEIAESKKETITADLIMKLVILLSYEEEDEINGTNNDSRINNGHAAISGHRIHDDAAGIQVQKHRPGRPSCP